MKGRDNMNTLKIKDAIKGMMVKGYCAAVDYSYYKINSAMPYVLSVLVPICMIALVKDIGTAVQMIHNM